MKEEAVVEWFALRDYPMSFDDEPTSKNRLLPDQDQMEFGVTILRKLVARGRKIYGHCKHGHGRAPTLVAAYLINKGKSPKAAEALIKSRRPTIHLEDAQRQALVEF